VKFAENKKAENPKTRMRKMVSISEQTSNKIEQASLFLLACSTVLPIRLMAGCLYLFVALNAFRAFSGWSYLRKIQFSTEQKNVILIFCLYFSLYLISIFWTTDLSLGFARIETKSTFILLPLSFFFFKIRIVNLTRLLWVFIYAVTGILLVCYIVAITYGFIHDDFITPFRYYNFAFWEGLHPGYLSLLILLSLTCILHIISHERKHWILLSVIIFFKVFSIVFIGARFAIALLIAIAAFALFDLVKKGLKIKWKKVLLISSICILPLALGIVTSKNTSARVLETKKSLEIRFEIYKTAFFLVKEKPLLGYGIGGDLKVLVDEYTKRGLKDAAEQQYNVHNQFMQTLIEVGIAGLILFAVLLLLIYRSSHVKVLTARILIIFMAFFLVESALQRIQGIVPFVTLSLVFCFMVSPTTDLSRK
jgi:O-antigen ligase